MSEDKRNNEKNQPDKNKEQGKIERYQYERRNNEGANDLFVRIQDKKRKEK